METSKYTGKTIIAIARERGSAAKTRAGAWKYLLANLPKPQRRSNSAPWVWASYRETRMERRADGRARILGYDPDDPNTPGRILEEAWAMNDKWDDDCRIAVERDRYGACYLNRNASPAARPRPEVDGWGAAWALIRNAVEREIIPAAYDDIDFDHKGRADGDALHHDLYDFRCGASVVCVRRAVGTRYGVKTKSKSYILVERRNRKITAREIAIPVAKYAKMPILHYGDIIAIARGEKKITLLSSVHQARRGYKVVRVDEQGRYVSVWDGSPWEIGATRVEAARENHVGGLYYYQDFQAMIRAADKNHIFRADMQHKRLAVLEVEASGVTIRYGDKYAATRITPVRHIASII